MTLTAAELAFARDVGLRRSRNSDARHGQHRFGWNPTLQQELAVEVQSATAELLASKLTHRKWLSTGDVPDDPHAGDLEGGVSVRWTDRPYGCLIVHETDPDNAPHLLVAGIWPNMSLRGWRHGWYCKHECFWRTNVRHPAFFVPQEALADWHDLILHTPTP